MKAISLVAVVACLFILSCHSPNHTANSTNTMSDSAQLDGNWVLNLITAPGQEIDSLYKTKKPTISFDLAANKFAGNTSCNNFNGPLKVSGNTISFADPFAMTRMACPGEGEKVFLETLNKVNRYSISNKNTLNFIVGDIAVMKFTRQ